MELITNEGTCSVCGTPTRIGCDCLTANAQREPLPCEKHFAPFGAQPLDYLTPDGDLKAAIAPPQRAREHSNPAEQHFAPFGLPDEYIDKGI